jgi:hypothetical protein
LSVKENAVIIDNIKIYPNPSQNLSTIEYTLPQGETKGEIIIYDIAGAVVKKVTVTSCSGKIELDNTALQSGTYFYQLTASNGATGAKKMVVIK